MEPFFDAATWITPSGASGAATFARVAESLNAVSRRGKPPGTVLDAIVAAALLAGVMLIAAWVVFLVWGFHALVTLLIPR